MRLAGGAVPPVNLRQGESLVVPVDLALLPPEAAFAVVTDPSGAENKVPLEMLRRTGVLEWNETRMPGIYEVQVPGQPLRYVSVSLPSGEGELRALDEAERQDVADGVKMRFTESWAELLREMERETGVRDLWRWLLIACLLLLSMEGVLAWRFSK